MEELMHTGWRFEFFLNKLETYTCIARKGDIEVSCDGFQWWNLICDIVEECDKFEETTLKGQKLLFTTD
jgi:hypothetical protein